jgi:hypothetical protein
VYRVLCLCDIARNDEKPVMMQCDSIITTVSVMIIINNDNIINIFTLDSIEYDIIIIIIIMQHAIERG